MKSRLKIGHNFVSDEAYRCRKGQTAAVEADRTTNCIRNPSRHSARPVKTGAGQKRLIARYRRDVSLRGLAICLIVVSGLAGPFRVFGLESHRNSPTDITVAGGRGEGPPKLVFACDGATNDVQRILSQDEVISDLKELNAGISLSLPDLSAERAQVVRLLNGANIPVTAWLTLPPEQGYYLNASNAREADARFSEFERWSNAYGLLWAGVGLDIEPNIQEFAVLRNGSKWRLVRTIMGRYFDLRQVQQAKQSYAGLIREIQAHGYSVETYQFPFITDERRAHSTLLERLAGIVDVRGDREALMLYTSFNPTLDSALIWVYGPEAQAIAVGSTSGPESAAHFARLNWSSFSRDLIVAHHFSHLIGVYNLEGCIQQDFLHRLLNFDWNQTVAIPAASVRKAFELRTRIERAIWIGSHLPYFAIFVVIASAVVIGRWRNRGRLEQRVNEMRESS
jgi:hypothetical protein